MKQQNELMNFLGARYSKDGKRVNVTLVSGKDNSRIYRNVSIALEDESKKIQVRVKNIKGKDHAIIYVPFFEEKKTEERDEDDAYNIPDDMPNQKEYKLSKALK